MDHSSWAYHEHNAHNELLHWVLSTRDLGFIYVSSEGRESDCICSFKFNYHTIATMTSISLYVYHQFIWGAWSVEWKFPIKIIWLIGCSQSEVFIWWLIVGRCFTSFVFLLKPLNYFLLRISNAVLLIGFFLTNSLSWLHNRYGVNSHDNYYSFPAENKYKQL